MKGESMSIEIFEDEYLKGINVSKNNLHGHIILAKYDKPLKHDSIG